MSLSNSLSDLERLSKEIRSLERKKQLCILLIPFLIGIRLRRQYNTELFQKNEEKNALFNVLKQDVEECTEEGDAYYQSISKSDEYLIFLNKMKIEAFLNTIDKDYSKFRSFDTILPGELKDTITSSQNRLGILRTNIQKYNEEFVKGKIIQYSSLFNKSSVLLDDEQKRAVVTDDRHNLIVAGAGSGKTEVLITRIAYLTRKSPNPINPERILALAYQRKAASEIKERLAKRYGIEVKIKNFHSLGNEIVQKSCQKRGIPIPILRYYENHYRNYIGELFDNMSKSPTFQSLIEKYMEYFWDDEIQKIQTDFENKEKFYEYMRNKRYTALNGQKVKSESERKILNFYLTHKINGKNILIEYEAPATWMKYSTKENVERAPCPDFFLPQFDLYHEHWAIDEQGNVPDWFEGKNPSEQYKKGMEVKRERFADQKKYGLIETFQWEAKNDEFEAIIGDKLVKALKIKYPNQSFDIHPLPYEEIIRNAWKDCRSVVQSLSGHIANFIVIAKTYNLKPEDVAKRLNTESWSPKQKAFGGIAIIIYEEYQQHLKKNHFLDFSDMINLAVDVLNEDKDLERDTLDHILIDEFQDISHQRYLLIKALMERNPNCKLFCVGDDWQSIMGFAGSNLHYFVNFEKYFDHPARTDLSTNYRSIKSIVDTGAEIIKHNREVQLEKITRSFHPEIKPILVVLIKNSSYDDFYFKMTHHCIDLIKDRINQGYQPQDILILARIKNNPRILSELLSHARMEHIPIFDEDKTARDIPFISVHRSKGLQARLVVILNMNQELYGFPCLLDNPTIYEPVKVDGRIDQLEEERRLFYVAITRAKEEVVIYADDSIKSEFLDEISRYTEITTI